jgi:hypothetical protein
MSVKLRGMELAEHLLHMPRDEHDVQAATMLRELIVVYELAREMVYAKTHQHSQACFSELIDVIKGKKGV